MDEESCAAGKAAVELSLSDRLSAHDESRRAVQSKIHEFCDEMKKMIDRFEESIVTEFEALFLAEDSRLQAALNCVRTGESSGKGPGPALEDIIRMGKAVLAVEQTYDFSAEKVMEAENPEEEHPDPYHPPPLRRFPPPPPPPQPLHARGELTLQDYLERYKLNARKRVVDEWLEFKKPSNLKVTKVCAGRIYLSFVGNVYEEAVLSKHGFGDLFQNDVCFTNKDSGDENVFTLRREESEGDPLYSFMPGILTPNTKYSMKVRMLYHGRESEWSDEAEFACGEFAESCMWLECSEAVNERMRYTVSDQSPRVVVKTDENRYFCSPLGSVVLPHSRETPWSVKVLKSKEGDCSNIYVGIAPSDMNQNNDFSFNKCGWYFSCFDSTLVSGPPHKYMKKDYGPRLQQDGWYVREGGTVGVVMDTAKGELSFILNGVNFGVAYDGIPLDKPLVPCVVLYHQDDSVELDFARVVTSVFSGACVPRNIVSKSSTWDSITLEWDPIEGALFYQIEVDGCKILDVSVANRFTKRGLGTSTEHIFRVRSVGDYSVSEWSDIVKGRTEEASFKTSGWKECPEEIEGKKYRVDGANSRIAIKAGYNYCYSVIVGNVPLLRGKPTSWKIKLLAISNPKSAFVGVVPFDVDQNTDECFRKRGWHIRCGDLTLSSGPPQNYRDRRYLERSKRVGAFDLIEVLMDMNRGALSFCVNGMNLGVAYEKIPLDKPLVPSVMVGMVDDSVEIILPNQ